MPKSIYLSGTDQFSGARSLTVVSLDRLNQIPGRQPYQEVRPTCKVIEFFRTCTESSFFFSPFRLYEMWGERCHRRAPMLRHPQFLAAGLPTHSRLSGRGYTKCLITAL